MTKNRSTPASLLKATHRLHHSSGSSWFIGSIHREHYQRKHLRCSIYNVESTLEILHRPHIHLQHCLPNLAEYQIGFTNCQTDFKIGVKNFPFLSSLMASCFSLSLCEFGYRSVNFVWIPFSSCSPPLSLSSTPTFCLTRLLKNSWIQKIWNFLASKFRSLSSWRNAESLVCCLELRQS